MIKHTYITYLRKIQNSVHRTNQSFIQTVVPLLRVSCDGIRSIFEYILRSSSDRPGRYRYKSEVRG